MRKFVLALVFAGTVAAQPGNMPGMPGLPDIPTPGISSELRRYLELTNDQLGAFVHAATVSLGGPAEALVLADVNQDGLVDLVTTHSESR